MKNKLACRWAFFYGAKISNESELFTFLGLFFLYMLV